MRVLVIGADTSLGRAIDLRLKNDGRHEIESLSGSACRWKSERQLKKTISRAKADIVVDVRIGGAVDGGEVVQELDLLRCHWLAKACQRNKVNYLYLSSSRVFSGDLERHYAEDDYPDSEETIGQLLLRAEQAVRDRCERHLILRLGPTFSAVGTNVLTHMLSQLVAGGTLELDNHLRGCPVESTDGARVVAALLDQLSTGVQAWGIFHYCSSDPTNCYEFAEVLLASASQFSEFGACAVELRKFTAPQPILNRALDCSRIRNTFAIQQIAWRGFTADNVKQYFQPSPQT